MSSPFFGIEGGKRNLEARVSPFPLFRVMESVENSCEFTTLPTARNSPPFPFREAFDFLHRGVEKWMETRVYIFLSLVVDWLILYTSLIRASQHVSIYYCRKMKPPKEPIKRLAIIRKPLEALLSSLCHSLHSTR